MADDQEKTHVLTSDVIITEIGRCEAGTMLSESDVLPSTWPWLQERNFLKSVEDIVREADEADGSESETTIDSEDDTEDGESETTIDDQLDEAGSDDTQATKPATGRRRK